MAEVQIGVPLPVTRFVSAKQSAELAQVLEATNVVDFAFVWDQLMGFWPEWLWQEHAPAGALPDANSFADPYLTLAAAATVTTTLGMATTTDGLRRGPAEFLQMALTLAGITEAQTTFFIGAGELKQAKPFGHRRSQGMARLEDLFTLLRLLLDADEPIDYEGNVWKFDAAWMGRGRLRVPKFFAMGAGPRLLDLAARHADGIFSVTPHAHSRPETVADEIAMLKKKVERAGRDPDAFTYALMHTVLLARDEDEYDRILDSPLLRYPAAIGGRLKMSDWEAEGLHSVMPLDWHYALHWIPCKASRAEVDSIVAATPREMAEKSVIGWTPEVVANHVRGFIEAGATMHAFIDLAPLLRPMDEGPLAVEKMLEVCRLLKSG